MSIFDAYRWTLAEAGCTVAHTSTDAGRALAPNTPQIETSMAPRLVAGEGYARPYLSLVPRDELRAVVEALDQSIDAGVVPETPALQGEVLEITGPALSLFRYGAGDRPVIIDIPTELASMTVRS